jgi:hypothetical protein
VHCSLHRLYPQACPSFLPSCACRAFDVPSNRDGNVGMAGKFRDSIKIAKSPSFWQFSHVSPVGAFHHLRFLLLGYWNPKLRREFPVAVGPHQCSIFNSSPISRGCLSPGDVYVISFCIVGTGFFVVQRRASLQDSGFNEHKWARRLSLVASHAEI